MPQGRIWVRGGPEGDEVLWIGIGDWDSSFEARIQASRLKFRPQGLKDLGFRIKASRLRFER